MSVNKNVTVPLGSSGTRSSLPHPLETGHSAASRQRGVSMSAGAGISASARLREVPVRRLTEKQREFLNNPFVGSVTDLRPDGSPHTTVVWVDADHGAELSFNTARGRFKERNLSRDPRISLLVVDPEDPYRWLSVSGTATLVDDGADEQIDRLSKKYLGKDKYPWRSSNERRVTVRISPEKIDSRGIDD
jgi:PPOX class probable F420-dependent enzyme